MKKLMSVFALLVGMHPMYTNGNIGQSALTLSHNIPGEKLYSLATDLISTKKDLVNSERESFNLDLSHDTVTYWKKYKKEISLSLALLTILATGYISVELYRKFFSERIDSFIKGMDEINKLGTFLCSEEGQRAVAALKLGSQITEEGHKILAVVENKAESFVAMFEAIKNNPFFQALRPL